MVFEGKGQHQHPPDLYGWEGADGPQGKGKAAPAPQAQSSKAQEKGKGEQEDPWPPPHLRSASCEKTQAKRRRTRTNCRTLTRNRRIARFVQCSSRTVFLRSWSISCISGYGVLPFSEGENQLGRRRNNPKTDNFDFQNGRCLPNASSQCGHLEDFIASNASRHRTLYGWGLGN